ncbi:MAG: tetratricopeptide repeat protein [candidate division Zixibacteria bacterium]|nr:tetratricopeptide repeat protein [candidate division Zixibacteria bacterium]
MNSVINLRNTIKLIALSAAVLAMAALSGGCATRGDVKEIMTDLEDLRISYRQLEEKNEEADSLLREQGRQMRNLSAEVNYSLDQLMERMQLIEGKLEDISTRMSGGYIHQEAPGPNAIPDSSADTTGRKDVEVSSKQLYDTAYMDFIKGDFKIAISGLREYLKNNPRSPLVDNARFIIAECYLNMKNYSKAVDEYNSLLKEHPRSEKVPSALVRLVEISLLRKDKRTANVYYNKLKESFPDELETERAKELIDNYRRRR